MALYTYSKKRKKKKISITLSSHHLDEMRYIWDHVKRIFQILNFIVTLLRRKLETLPALVRRIFSPVMSHAPAAGRGDLEAGGATDDQNGMEGIQQAESEYDTHPEGTDVSSVAQS